LAFFANVDVRLVLPFGMNLSSRCPLRNRAHFVDHTASCHAASSTIRRLTQAPA
jgi:hypothetical protein